MKIYKVTVATNNGDTKQFKCGSFEFNGSFVTFHNAIPNGTDDLIEYYIFSSEMAHEIMIDPVTI